MSLRAESSGVQWLLRKRENLLYPFLPLGAFPPRGSEWAVAVAVGEDGGAEVGGARAAAVSLPEAVSPGLGARRGPLLGEVGTEYFPPLSRDSFVPGDEGDTCIAPAFQMGKPRLGGPVTASTEPEANLDTVRLTPESVVSPLLNSLGNTLSP